MAVESAQVIAWDIYDYEDNVVNPVLARLAPEVYHREYGDTIRLGWPDTRFVSLVELTKGHWWRRQG